MEERNALRARALVVAGAGLLAVIAACNAVLGIDEQGTRPVPDDARALDGPKAGTRPSFEKCTSDVDCVAPNGCYTPHCDTVLGACTYALCEAKDRTCARGVCNTATFACSDPLPYGFHATTYDVAGVTSGCGPHPESCVASAFPFVLLGTRDAVVALRGDDLTGTSAITVPITGITVVPQQLVASGRRIWVLGAVQGTAPPYQLPIGLVDVPSDPTAPELHAQTMLVSYSFPSAVGFAAPNGGLFVTYNDATQGLPSALVPGPLPDGTALGVTNGPDAGAFDGGSTTRSAGPDMVRVAAPAGSMIVASSGGRLVTYRYPSTFNLVAQAGTPTAAVQGDLALAAGLVPIGGVSIAEGPDGTVMMNAAIAADAVGDCNCTSHARLQWVFPNAIATTTDVNQLIDPEVWINPQVPAAACHVCTGDYDRRVPLSAWVDHRTVLVAAPASGLAVARNVTDVRLLARDPLDGYPKRRFSTKATDTPKGEAGIDRIALTASSGIGYLVLADGQGNDVTMSIVDTRCDAVGP